MVLDASDMDTLMAWRRTCVTFGARVKRILQSLIHAIVGYYLPDPLLFMHIIRRHRAVIIAEAALAFFLRDTSVLAMDLTVCAIPRDMRALRDELLRAFPMHPIDEGLAYHSLNDFMLFRIRPHRYIRFVTTTPYFDRNVPQFVPSPVGRVAAAPHTAFHNFVGADVFGCGYPQLTLRRRVLLRTIWAGYNTPERRAILRLCALGRFQFSSDPSHLFDNLAPRTVDCLGHRSSCIASHYVCDCQVRYFGDGASLVDFFDLDGARPFDLLHSNITGHIDGEAPGWRVWICATRPCVNYSGVYVADTTGSWPVARESLRFGPVAYPV